MNKLNLLSMPGTYCLVMELTDESVLSVGRLGDCHLHPGYYLYTGSARGPGGVSARVGRHLRRNKPLRWHIDYLTQRARVIAVPSIYGAEKLECVWATRLAESLILPVSGFGSSDCRCEAHLFYSQRDPTVLASTLAAPQPGC